MRRQRNTTQMKEQKKTLEKELNKMEISNLSGAEFRNTGYKGAQGNQWVLQKHKMNQSEIGDTN